jgi:hypothetical protein
LEKISNSESQVGKKAFLPRGTPGVGWGNDVLFNHVFKNMTIGFLSSVPHYFISRQNIFSWEI